MIARHHELTGFATGAVTGSALGATWLGSLLLGALGAYAADLPDIDSPRARIVTLLGLVWYPTRALDSNGRQKRRKPRQKPTTVRAKAKGRTRAQAKTRARRKAQSKARWTSVRRFIGEAIVGAHDPEGARVWVWRPFPGYQVHRLSVWVSEIVYDACATQSDRRDVVPEQGPRFRSHRGLTHSLWACLGVGALVWALSGWLGTILEPRLSPTVWLSVSSVFGPVRLSVLVGVVVFVGMLTHIAGDGCTDMGVSVLAPFVPWKGRRYPVQGLLLEPFRFKTGKTVERDYIVFACCGMAAGAVLFVCGALGPFIRAIMQLWHSLS